MNHSYFSAIAFSCFSILLTASEKKEGQLNRFKKFEGMTLSTTISIDERDFFYRLAPKPETTYDNNYCMPSVSTVEIFVPIKKEQLNATVNGVTKFYSAFCAWNEQRTWDETSIPLSVITQNLPLEQSLHLEKIEGFLQVGTTQHYRYGKANRCHNNLTFTKEKVFVPWKTSGRQYDRVQVYTPRSVYYIPITMVLSNNLTEVFVKKMNQFLNHPQAQLLYNNADGMCLFSNKPEESKQREIEFIEKEVNRENLDIFTPNAIK